jgi:hypothetical protein
MNTLRTAWIRSLLLALVVGGAALLSACDWANVGGPW